MEEQEEGETGTEQVTWGASDPTPEAGKSQEMLLGHGVRVGTAGLLGAPLVWQFSGGGGFLLFGRGQSAHTLSGVTPVGRGVQRCQGRRLPRDGIPVAPLLGPGEEVPWGPGQVPPRTRGWLPAHGTRVASRAV